jgi:acyl transferase domain-containing protein/NADPH:quinone reductase-like Zn-dependent oxidoreductase/acyl carrier protein
MSEKPDDERDLSPTKRALLALEEMQSRLNAVEEARSEPIAIIGMSCRFPGGANDPEAYWRLLIDGTDAITEVPKSRWNADDFYDPDPDAPGKIYTRYGGFIDQVDEFDPGFFDISPREALSLDPQQRLLLEVSWEAIEHAGIPADRLKETQTGVFVGVMENHYAKLHLGADPESLDAYYVTGNHMSFTSGRISFLMGLQGPAVTLDTACSSSLVTVHLACQSLRAGESELALAGGVNLLLSPDTALSLCRFRAFSADGRCKTFDASADGFGQGEGCGILVLKRLSKALQDGDRVMAVIRGSAVNHDGASAGLTVPNGLAQQALIRKALANARLAPADVQYVEAHGTGTSLGDPIEVRALGAVLAKGRQPGNRVVLGSAKANIGHTESAAGVAGLIKVVLSLQHNQIPANIHVREINPHISLDESPVDIPTEPVLWESGGRPRVAGVSSFGLSGTNAHVLIQEAPPEALHAAEPPSHPAELLVLSAKTREALRDLAGRHASHLGADGDLRLADYAYTSRAGRVHFDHRLAFAPSSIDEARQVLDAVAQEGDPGELMTRVRKSNNIVFFFTGQGAQHVGMGRLLYDSLPAFRDTVDRCNEILAPILDRPLLSVLFPDANGNPDLINETAYTQPALFTLEYALASLLISWGIKPAAVVGHSVGEYVAACVAGVFSLEDGLRLIATRGRLMQGLPKNGSMAVVFAPEDVVADAIAPHTDVISIAAANGPQSVVISGESGALSSILQELEASGTSSRRLVVSHAFHSPLMEPILDEFERTARSVRFVSPRIPVVSNLTGAFLGPNELQDAGYWRRHIREAVQFCSAVRTLREGGFDTFCEIGPHPTLLGMARLSISDPSQVAWVPSLNRSGNDWVQILETAGKLHAVGAELNWQRFEADCGGSRNRVAMPTYPFQRERFWLEKGGVFDGRAPSSRHLRAEDTSAALLGQRIRSPLNTIQYESLVGATSTSFMVDHKVAGAVLMPGTAYLEMALAAADDVWGSATIELSDVEFRKTLLLPDDEEEAAEVQLLLERSNGGGTFEVLSLDDEQWVSHAAGRVKTDGTWGQPARADLEALQAGCKDTLHAADFYAQLQKMGLEYGPAFQGIASLAVSPGEALAELAFPESCVSSVGEFHCHPAMLDAALQSALAATPAISSNGESEHAYLPVRIERFRLYRSSVLPRWSHVQLRPSTAEADAAKLLADVRLIDAAGNLISEASGLELQRVPTVLLRRMFKQDLANWLYQVDWKASELPSGAEAPASGGAPGKWLLFAKGSPLIQSLRARLEAAGDACEIIEPGEKYERAKPGGSWSVEPGTLFDFQQLMHEIGGRSQKIKGVVYLWGLGCTSAGLDQQQISGGALHLVQALTADQDVGSPRLWLVSRGTQSVGPDGVTTKPAQATLWGLGSTILAEMPALRCSRVDLDPFPELDESELLFRELSSDLRDNQVAYRASTRYVAGLARHSTGSVAATRVLSAPKAQPYVLEAASPGLLDSLTLRQTSRATPGPGEVEIQVLATGLNFKDILKALRRYPGTDLRLGDECAGIVTAVGEGVSSVKEGDEVLAVAYGSFSKYVVTPEHMVVLKPPGMSFETAASIPITFLTAWYALRELARISPGQRVLIHSGAGGVGMAAIQIAKQAGAEVFATAGSPRKRAYLRSLGVEHVLDSRSLDFADAVMAQTSGQGVDIVLNALAGEFIPKSFAVLADTGCFVEIGKTGIWDQAQATLVKPRASYHVFYLGDVAEQEPDAFRGVLHALLDAMREGSLAPLPLRTFSIEQSIEAFRFMAQAKHIGKIVISQRSEIGARAHPGIRMDGTYLVTGGLGGLGLASAQWLASQGARHLVLTGRSGGSEKARAKVAELEGQGVSVRIARADVSKREELEHVLTDLEGSMPPLRGVFHAAGVLEDGVLMRQNWDRFEKVYAPKIDGAWHLHELTLEKPLDLFVLYSSTAPILGAAGQSNYAAANAYMDALAHWRSGQGLPALSINWGPWSEVGMVADMDEVNQRRLSEQGMSLISPDQGLRLLGSLITESTPQVVVLPIDWEKYGSAFPSAAESSFLEDLLHSDGGGTDSETVALASRETIAAVTGAERRQLLEESLRGMTAKVLKMKPSNIDTALTLKKAGVDSLMALELLNQIEKTYGHKLSVKSDSTLDDLIAAMCASAW